MVLSLLWCSDAYFGSIKNFFTTWWDASKPQDILYQIEGTGFWSRDKIVVETWNKVDARFGRHAVWVRESEVNRPRNTVGLFAIPAASPQN